MARSDEAHLLKDAKIRKLEKRLKAYTNMREYDRKVKKKKKNLCT